MSDTFYLRSKHKNFNTYTDVVDFEVVYPGGLRLDLIICGIIFLSLLMAVFVWFINEEIGTWFSYVFDSQETTAYISSCQYSYHSARKQYDHTLVYYFEFPDSPRYFGQASSISSRNQCEEFVNGSSISIQYLRSNPQESRITNSEIPILQIIMLLPIFAFYVVWIWSFIALRDYIRSQIKWRRLAREGHIFPGEIISNPYKQKNRGLPALNNTELYYTFVDAVGDRHTGKTIVPYELQEQLRMPYKLGRTSTGRIEIPPRRITKLPEPGTPVAILYAGGDCHVML